MTDTAVPFDFVDINPGFSGLAFAAEAEGGTCVGVHGVRVGNMAAYEDFFGRGSAAAPITTCDIVLADLPFSLFVRAKDCDPAISDAIVLAEQASQGSAPILFRIHWSAAHRLGVEVSEYEAAIQAVFSPRKWKTTSAVAGLGNDLFVSVVDKEIWNGEDQLPATFPTATVASLRVNPQEILLARGYPEKFSLRNAGVDPKLVEGIVVVGNARAAISATLGSVR